MGCAAARVLVLVALATGAGAVGCGPPGGPAPIADAPEGPSLYGGPKAPSDDLGRPGDPLQGLVPDRGPLPDRAESAAPPRLPRDEVSLLGPGDVVHIAVWDHPDLTMSVEVSSDGTFQFPLIGSVRAAQLSVAQLEGDLARRLADGYLVNPQVAVRVESRGKCFYVYGEVAKPGRYALDREVTVLQAISTAGGPTERADERRSTVTRREGETTVSRRVALDEQVRDQDTLYVPMSLF